MSLFGIGSSTSTAMSALLGQGASAQSATTSGSLAYGGLSAAAVGAQLPQKPSIGGIIKKMLIGGVVGGALGAGIGLIPAAIPFVGGISVPMGAMIGGIAGAVLGLAKGFLDFRKGKLAYSAATAPGAGLAPTNISARALNGPTLKKGAKGSLVRSTQKNLLTLGLLSGKATGVMDAKTVTAIKKYEKLKGVPPTGTSTPGLRWELAQDTQALRQYA